MVFICNQKQEIIRNNSHINNQNFQLLKVTLQDNYDHMGRINYDIITEIVDNRIDFNSNVFYLDGAINALDFWKKVCK